MPSVIKGDSNVNLDFSTGGRITGDFSNATLANRVFFQNSVINGASDVAVIPNGTSQAANFTAFGSSSDQANTTLMRIGVNSTETLINSFRTGTGTYLPMTFYTGGSERMRIATSGQVLVGASSGDAYNPLQVQSMLGFATTGGYYSEINNNMYYGSAAWRNKNQGPASQIVLDGGASQASAIRFNVSSAATSTAANTAISLTEAMRIDSSNGLRVGTTSNIFNGATTEKLTVRNTSNGCAATFQADNVAGGFPVVYVSSTLADGATQNAILFVRSTVSVGTITTTTTSTQYNTSSDYRLKHDIQPMTGALAKVSALKPVTYKWNADDSDGEGFIAHELAEVCPSAVTGEKDATRIEQYEISPAVPATYDEEGNELTPAVEAVMGEREVPVYQGIDTSFLVATLTAAIQELKAIVDAQGAEIAALKGTA